MSGGGVFAADFADQDRLRGEHSREVRLKVPSCARHTAKQVQAQRPEFRKCVAGQMRLGQKAKARDSAGAGKLVPMGRTNGAQVEIGDDVREQFFSRAHTAKRVRTTTLRIDNPFGPMHRL